MADMIAYEQHPVSPERKKELREQGYKILDVIFKPVEVEQEEKPKRQSKSKAAE